MHPRNLELLEITAKRLEPILAEVVFVGGCTTGLLVTDPAAAPPRTTYDVDVIAEIASCAEYMAFSERLRSLGFEEDSSEGAPVCRWNHSGLVLDVMPLDAKILGFSNRWCADALRTARDERLSSGLNIRVVTAPYFLGTKFEAFRGHLCSKRFLPPRRTYGDSLLAHSNRACASRAFWTLCLDTCCRTKPTRLDLDN
jgi:hypothetical protein